jgi:hypothetical protein
MRRRRRERAQKVVLNVEPKQRLVALRPALCGPCGGFVLAFRAMLNYNHAPYAVRAPLSSRNLVYPVFVRAILIRLRSFRRALSTKFAIW